MGSTSTSGRYSDGEAPWANEQVLIGSGRGLAGRGSRTTILPPRAYSAFSRLGKSGTVIMLPFEAMGLAPSTKK
jgi:hypothetical protein